ncbi:MAG: ABC transporter permease [Lachnospiraceae bacterium]|nr:ABC transporter permease [Lachnospiraceae bacterium]
MRKLFSADTFRMFHSSWFWLCLGGMLAMSVGFIVMQHTAMDYEVPLSRVIFLPMSFYGVATAALLSLFIGEDFSDGFIRNKIVAGHSRHSIFISNLIVSWLACIVIYLSVVFFTTMIGRTLFEVDFTVELFLQYLFLGIGMCIAYGCIYCSITMLCGNKVTATLLCMGLAFFMLFACLHTNQTMVQPEYKNGVPNPAYVDGVVKTVYAVLHDLNPFGQAAQLSAMEVFDPVRWFICDLGWVLAAGIGCAFFNRKNIQ